MVAHAAADSRSMPRSKSWGAPAWNSSSTAPAHARAIVDGIGQLPGTEVLWNSQLNQGLVRFIDARPGAGETDHDARTDTVIAAVNATGEAFFSGTTWRGKLSDASQRRQLANVGIRRATGHQRGSLRADARKSIYGPKATRCARLWRPIGPVPVTAPGLRPLAPQLGSRQSACRLPRRGPESGGRRPSPDRRRRPGSPRRLR